MNRNTIWLYGDSFTEGEGTAMLYKGHEEYHRAYNRYFWGHYYRDKWLPGYTLVNRGVSGASTQHILNSILEDIHKWREGDVAIFGLSSPMRYTFACEDAWGPGSRNGYVHISGAWHGIYQNWNTLVQNNLGDELDPGLKIFTDKVLLTNMYAIERQNLRHRDLTGNIMKTAQRRGITCMMWDFLLWSYFQKLMEWSNNIINDSHWSPNGNIQFAHLLKDCMERGIYDLTSDYTSDFVNNPTYDPFRSYKEKGIWKYLSHSKERDPGRMRFISPSYKALLKELNVDYLVEYNPTIDYRV